MDYHNRRIHSTTYVEDGEGILAAPQGIPVPGGYIFVVSAEAIAGSEVDREAEAKGQDPGEDDEVVVPAHLAHNACPRHQSCSHKTGGQDEGSSGHGEDCGAAIEKIAGRHINASVFAG